MFVITAGSGFVVILSRSYPRCFVLMIMFKLCRPVWEGQSALARPLP